MKTLFIALRTAIFGTGFIWLWGWVAWSLHRRYNRSLKGLERYRRYNHSVQGWATQARYKGRRSSWRSSGSRPAGSIRDLPRRPVSRLLM